MSIPIHSIWESPPRALNCHATATSWSLNCFATATPLPLNSCYSTASDLPYYFHSTATELPCYCPSTATDSPDDATAMLLYWLIKIMIDNRFTVAFCDCLIHWFICSLFHVVICLIEKYFPIFSYLQNDFCAYVKKKHNQVFRGQDIGRSPNLSWERQIANTVKELEKAIFSQ